MPARRSQTPPRAPQRPQTATLAAVGRQDATPPSEPLRAIYAALTEREFQAEVVRALKARGWIVWTVPNMRLTTAGLPDVIAYHPARPGVLLMWELKRERRYVVSGSQTAALAHLATVPGVDARIVRPSDWPALRDALEV